MTRKKLIKSEKTDSLYKITPKNRKQREFLTAIEEFPIVFATGSAGTGKTFLSAAVAMEKLRFSFVDKIIIVRPVVATENLGFLPGDIKEKLDPYLIPIIDALEEVSDPTFVAELEYNNILQIAPLAFMRGRTLNNAFVILDEAQNTTIEQMRMFLTRFGENVKVAITGDLSQSDIRGQNGLQWAIEKLAECNSVRVIKYNNSEVVRSTLVKELLKYIDGDNQIISESKQDTYIALPKSIQRTTESSAQSYT